MRQFGIPFTPKRIKSFFLNENKGNIAILTAVSLLAIVTGVGAAVDYSRAFNIKSKLQQSADSAALAAARVDIDNNQEMRRTGRIFFYQNVTNGIIGKKTKVRVKRIKGGVRVTAKAKVGTTFLSIVNVKTIDVSVLSEASTPSQEKLEIVLMVDSTSSMRGRLKEIKKSATALVNTLMTKDTGGDVKFGLIPYSKYVNVGTGNLNTPGIYVHPSNPSWTWYGCMGSRSNILDVRDNNYASNPAPGLRQQNNYYCKIRPLTRLTTNKAVIKQGINHLNSLGIDEFVYLEPALLWGWSLLSKDIPFTEADSYSSGTKKVIIMVNDSVNTRGPNNAFPYNANDPNHYNKDTSVSDDRVRYVCKNIRSKGIMVFIIEFGKGKILKNCALNGGKFYKVEKTKKLKKVFKEITEKISDGDDGGSGGVLRITR